MAFMDDSELINTRLAEIREFRRIREEEDDFPLNFFFDVRQSVARLKLKGTHMEEQELFDLMRCLITIAEIKQFLAPKDEGDAPSYPHLHALSKEVLTFRDDIRSIQAILDKFGHIKDQASPTLFHIRLEQKKMEGNVSRTLNAILRSAQAEGHVDKDVTPTMRDGRLVIPIQPAMKRKIQGIVHDESATGKTLFLEPTAVVEANNRIRELEAEEKREIIRILTEMSDKLRPDADGILESVKFLAQIDFIQAKAQLAEQFNAFEPEVLPYPHIDWIRAIHPLLQESLQRQGKSVVPLDIELSAERDSSKVQDASLVQGVQEDSYRSGGATYRSEAYRSEHSSRIVPVPVPVNVPVPTILIISGPNAGGKSVCLKTVGLLQYMLQCGLSIPVGDRSTCGTFRNIMIDIGDQQSIEDDLSTYSSHLLNMKTMIRHANEHTLLLIDEFGTGTEPQIGGAIAEAVLRQFCAHSAWGIITTHYQNLKDFATRQADVQGVQDALRAGSNASLALALRRCSGEQSSEQGVQDASLVQGVQEDSYRSGGATYRSAANRSEAYRSEPGSRIVPVSKVLNGAMLYDRHEMKALFQLQTGRPGSSFAIEIARKTGLPEEVIKDASDIVGQDYIQSDKYLQDIVRDKRYWERKRETVHQREKDIEKTITRYESSVEEIEKERKAILRRAKEQAEELLREANRRIEHTIREIREAEAEREATRRLREDLNDFKSEVQTIDSTQTDAAIEKKMQQIIARKERQAKRKAEKKDSPLTPLLNRGEQSQNASSKSSQSENAYSSPLSKRGAGGESLSPKLAALLDHWQGGGDIKEDSRLNKPQSSHLYQRGAGSESTRQVIDAHKQNFRQEIDVRGLRGDEALLEVQHFIDDAILIGSHTVRILHGKGNGILRELIRNYLNALPNVIGCRDEHIQFGGSGITVVDLG